MSDRVVVDTGVLQKANAPLLVEPGRNSKFRKRLDVLSRIQCGRLRVLISPRLMAEYRKQIPQPRNHYVTSFFTLLSRPGSAIPNWSSWSGRVRSHAGKCRFPHEDRHVLQTAVCNEGSTILCEEHRMVVTDACVHRTLGVHIVDPTV